MVASGGAATLADAAATVEATVQADWADDGAVLDWLRSNEAAVAAHLAESEKAAVVAKREDRGVWTADRVSEAFARHEMYCSCAQIGKHVRSGASSFCLGDHGSNAPARSACTRAGKYTDADMAD